MANEKKWSKKRKREEIKKAKEYLSTFNCNT